MREQNRDEYGGALDRTSAMMIKFEEKFKSFGIDPNHIKGVSNYLYRKILDNNIHVINSNDGQIPIISVVGRSLPEAWETSLIALLAYGTHIKTQYDKPDDLPSLDCTMIMVVEDPLAEPRIHRSFPGGIEDLEEYRLEVVEGIKNHWVRDPNNPDDTRWEYTYNERMFKYKVPFLESINQFEKMALILTNSPISRRAQMISWQPWLDLGISDPACWQSLWGRITEDDNGQKFLNLNMRFRSRDAYKAAFMNDFAFINLGEKLASRISELRNEPIKLGRFMDQSDSYHIYGSYFKEFSDSFIKLLSVRPKLEDRTWTSEFVKDTFDMEEVRTNIKNKIEVQDEKYK